METNDTKEVELAGNSQNSDDSINGEFQDIPIGSIVIKGRLRTEIDKDDDSFVGLMKSIQQRGVLEPIIVVKSGDSYELMCGERRLRACQQLGLSTIPSRILSQPLTSYDRLEIELIENLFRQDLNPINEANGYRRYFEERLNISLDDAIKNLILYGWKDGRIQGEVMESISTIVKFSSKSSKTIQNLLKLLKLPDPIQKALESGKINISLGGVFASNLNHPMLMTIFHACCQNPMTKERLIIAFDHYEGPVNVEINYYQKYSKNVESLRQGIKRNTDHICVDEAQILLRQLTEMGKQLSKMIESGEFMPKNDNLKNT
jgi:hypothetical protein